MTAVLPFEGNIMEDFKCPICTNYMFAPIRQCLNGHSYCNDCFNRIRTCGLCRGLKVSARNYTLESIQSKVTFPCRYQIDGCVMGAKGVLVKEHEKYCDYSKKRCPLTTDYCTWTGRKIDFIHHAQDYHAPYVYYEYRKMLVAKAFVNFFKRRSRYNFLFAVFNEIFRFTWMINDQSAEMRFAVYNIRRPMEDQFSYKIIFLKGKSNTEAISFKSPCVYCDSDSDEFIPGSYLMTDYNMLKRICDIKGDLYYVVEILNNNAFTKFVKDYFIAKPAIFNMDK